jgi:hypothetical protein
MSGAIHDDETKWSTLLVLVLLLVVFLALSSLSVKARRHWPLTKAKKELV